MKKYPFLLLLLVALLLGCEKEKTSSPVDPNAIKQSLSGSWIGNFGQTPFDTLKFHGDSLECINDMPLEFKGSYSISSGGNIIAYNVLSVTINGEYRTEFIGMSYYTLDFITADSIRMMYCEKWNRISGNLNSLSESIFHRFDTVHESGMIKYIHHKLEFSNDKITRSILKTSDIGYPTDGWHIEHINSVKIESDYFFMDGSMNTAKLYRFSGSDVYIGFYTLYSTFKRK